MAMSAEMNKLTLGPVLFNWSPEKWRDFYFRIADEAPVDSVCVGEVVCSKRQPFFEPVIADVVERLQSAGKEIVLSTLALIMSPRETRMVQELASDSDFLIEANDISAVSLLAGQDHVIGPFVNVYNEGTRDYLISNGATRICLPFELPGSSISAIAEGCPADTQLEVQVFGRLPLAISARCYHARSYDLAKDNCQFVCADDPDGMAVDTLDGTPFLNVNGTQTLSRSCRVLGDEISTLKEMGVYRFRLSPMDTDMVAVAKGFRQVLEGDNEPQALVQELQELLPAVSFSNGFFHGVEGRIYREQGE
jgi:O2-independent ubiquinone biosynthesis protein UbiV